MHSSAIRGKLTRFFFLFFSSFFVCSSFLTTCKTFALREEKTKNKCSRKCRLFIVDAHWNSCSNVQNSPQLLKRTSGLIKQPTLQLSWNQVSSVTLCARRSWPTFPLLLPSLFFICCWSHSTLLCFLYFSLLSFLHLLLCAEAHWVWLVLLWKS